MDWLFAIRDVQKFCENIWESKQVTSARLMSQRMRSNYFFRFRYSFRIIWSYYLGEREGWISRRVVAW